MEITHEQHCEVVRKLDNRIIQLKHDIDYAFEVHEKIIDEQNRMVLFMKEKGILNEYYERYK